MFSLALVEDIVRTPAELFSRPRFDTLQYLINLKYADKLLPHIGLCMGLYDFVSGLDAGNNLTTTITKEKSSTDPVSFSKEVKDIQKMITTLKATNGVITTTTSYTLDRIPPGESASYTTVRFRILVFRPFPDEVFMAKISSSDSEGITLSMNFFTAHIRVPTKWLPSPSTYDQEEKVWVWEFQGQQLFMDLDNQVRVKVVNVIFSKPKVPITPIENQNDVDASNISDQPQQQQSTMIMLIEGRMDEAGLGMIEWWESS